MKKSIVYFLRTKAVKSVWEKVAAAAIRMFGPRFAAHLTYLGIDWGPYNPDYPNVLCISRFFFEKDIEQMKHRTRLNFISILGGFVRFQLPWFPPKMQIQTFYQGYVGPGRDRALTLSTQYAQHLLKLVERKRKVAAVLSANFDYWQDLGFKRACMENGIPFLVLSREHLTIPAEYQKVLNWYKESQYVFEGQGIAVAGSETKRAIEEVGHVIKAEDVVITGFPRMDIWKDVDTSRPMPQRPYVTLVTYTHNYYADENFKEVARAFVRIADRLRDRGVEFLIKCKDYDDQCQVEDILHGLNLQAVTLTHSQGLFDIFPKSRLVIGFNSLALVEAVIARAPLLSPYWGDCRKEAANLMYNPSDPAIGACMLLPESLVEFEEQITAAVDLKYSLLEPEQVHKFINKFFYFPKSGTCSAEVEKFIKRYVDRPLRRPDEPRLIEGQDESLPLPI